MMRRYAAVTDTTLRRAAEAGSGSQPTNVLGLAPAILCPGMCPGDCAPAIVDLSLERR